MEHRLSIRRPIGIDIVLYYNGLDMIRCQSTDISPEGLYVEADAMCLKLNTPVEVAIAVREDDHIVMNLVPAMVARVTSSGMGLMFREVNQKIYECLQNPQYENCLLSMEQVVHRGHN